MLIGPLPDTPGIHIECFPECCCIVRDRHFQDCYHFARMSWILFPCAFTIFLSEITEMPGLPHFRVLSVARHFLLKALRITRAQQICPPWRPAPGQHQ